LSAGGAFEQPRASVRNRAERAKDGSVWMRMPRLEHVAYPRLRLAPDRWKSGNLPHWRLCRCAA
jgi:hypothetical protein